MASKEITTFIIDLSPSMANKSNGRNISDLEFGLKYFYDIVSTKILKGRKTDYISILTCHAEKTDNPFARDDSFRKIEVLASQIVPSYDDLVKFSQQLVPNMSEIEDTEGDCFETMLVAIGLLKETQRLKFIRNVVVITNGESSIKSFYGQVSEATKKAVNEMNINIVLNGIDFDTEGSKDDSKSPLKAANEAGWISTFEEYKKGQVLNTANVVEAIQYNPPLKKVKPMKAYRGQMRFGSEFRSDEDSDYKPEIDQTNLCFNVELYPATKVEKVVSGHQYVINTDNNNVDKIKTVTDYFIKQNSTGLDNNEDDEVQDKKYVADDDEDDGNENVAINPNEWTYGFKYSNYDLLTLDDDLINSTKLAGEPGMDIFGFIKMNDLPYAYLTGESFYILPESSGSYRNLIGFNCFCQSLMELESFALMRFVQKYNDEIQICVTMPSKVKVHDKFVYSFILVRLPFKEDEKIGNFPTLTSITSTSGKEFTSNYESESGQENEVNNENTGASMNSNLPSKRANDLMESFIHSKSLDKKVVKKEFENTIESTGSFIDNEKIVLSNESLIMFPNKYKENITSNIVASSPAIHKFNLNLKKIIIQSLKENGDLHKYLNNPNFIKDNLLRDNSDGRLTNLFNMSNILKINSSISDNWLTDINDSSMKFTKDLIKELDVKYVKQDEDSKRSKRKKLNNNNMNDIFAMKNAQGNYGAGDGEYDELPDIEELLN